MANFNKGDFKKVIHSQHWWLTPVILANQDAEDQGWKTAPGKYFERPYLKKLIMKKGWWSGSRRRS
jgi:hypothetical protein